jgi:mono/diheme cytochrome c family protein
MSRRIRIFICLLLLLPVAFILACSGASQPPAEQPKPAEPPKPAADVAGHMHEHMARVIEMQDAVIRGDIEAAVAPAKWIADHQEIEGLPAGTETIVANMKKQAAAVAEAKDLKNAGVATAMTLSYCGSCHAAAKVTPQMMMPVALPVTSGVKAHMMEHQLATDLMYQGLTMPSEERWQKGLDAMQVSPLAEKDMPKDAKLTKEIVALEKRVHEVAAQAKKTTDVGTKVALYGEYLSGCAGCHSLHGKVWGPGLPKTQ